MILRRSIEGVDTTTAGFIGPTQRGPNAGPPEALPSFAVYERIYGGPGDLVVDGEATTNYMFHAARAYFEEGGTRLYVSRVSDESVEQYRQGLVRFEAIEDLSIVAAPGASRYSHGQDVGTELVRHCETMRYRMAVLDTPPGASVQEACDYRRQTQASPHAAMYHPWVTVDVRGGTPLQLPPSGFVAGIWARNDVDHSVSRSPADEEVGSAADLEVRLDREQQDALQAEGVNCLRFIPDRGVVVWGARTLSDDPEWRYVNVRRYLAYLEHSIDRGTRWAMFEPSDEALWAEVRDTVEEFLMAEWQAGALQGTRAEEAFFVRCDRSTMTQDDVDNGWLMCLIGVALLRPAEFVIFRIGQWPAGWSAS